MHGYQLMQTIGERTNGRWAPSPGAIYPTLSQLEDEGLVVVQKDGGRKLASLTETGTTLVSEQKGSWNSPFGDQDQEAEIPDLRVALHDLGGAIREVQRSGTAGQIGQVAELLAGTKRAVYGILASEQEPGASAEAADADGVDDTDPADTTDE
jgi:DNA-binding PadR family transcriptional regulator